MVSFEQRHDEGPTLQRSLEEVALVADVDGWMIRENGDADSFYIG